MSDTLAKIVDDKRRHVAACKDRRSQAECEKMAKAAEPPRGTDTTSLSSPWRASLPSRTSRTSRTSGLIARVR